MSIAGSVACALTSKLMNSTLATLCCLLSSSLALTSIVGKSVVVEELEDDDEEEELLLLVALDDELDEEPFSEPRAIAVSVACALTSTQLTAVLIAFDLIVVFAVFGVTSADALFRRAWSSVAISV